MDESIVNDDDQKMSLKFIPALSSNFNSSTTMSGYQIIAYENAMQYLQVYSQHESLTTMYRTYSNMNDSKNYKDCIFR